MTTQELEQLVYKTLPNLKKKLFKTELDQDILQETLINLALKAQEYTLCTPEQFFHLVCSHFYHRVWYLNRKMYRSVLYGDLIGDKHLKYGGSKVMTYATEFVREGMEQADRANNPFANITVEALEYIALVKDETVHRRMMKHYIEGYTIQEIAHQESRAVSSIHESLSRGITEIKQLMKEGVI